MSRSSRTVVALMTVASAMPITVTVANAAEYSGSSQSTSLAAREMIRRQQAVTEADALLLEGRAAYAKKDYQQALDKFTQALSKLPDAPMLADRRKSVTDQLTDASVALAQQFRRVGGKDPAKGGKGKYDDARALLEDALTADPQNAAAKRELAYLEDPIRTNPTLDYKHSQDVDAVRRGLYTAEGYYNNGKYDAAKREYEKVLRIDQFNSAARRGMEVLASAKTAYYRAAYDQTRAELLMEVDKAWELSVPAGMPPGGVPTTDGPGVSSGTAYINEKLRRIIIPNIAFDDITVEEAVDFLRLRAAELDLLEPDPNQKGVNFLIRRPAAPVAGAGDAGLEAAPEPGALPTGASPGSLRIKSLRLTNIPLGQALKYICDATKLRFKVDDFAVTLVPMTETGNETFTRTFRVPPGFSDSLSGGGGDEPAAAADPFAGAAESGGGGGKAIKPRRPILDLLKKAGIVFGEGSSATLSPGGLLVTNTAAELDRIEQLVNNMRGGQPKQIKITTKFVEITQENNDELSFDWLVTPFGLGSNTLYGSGGTNGNGHVRQGRDFVNPINGVSLPGIPSNPLLPATNVSTTGNRSGDAALNRNSIDAILNNPLRTASTNNVAPGIASITGLFSDGQVQLIMRGLSQKKGTDLMTAPSVMAKPGQKATIEIVREFIYPTEYEPPQLPQQNNNNFGGVGGAIGGGGGGIATPSTPTAWETRNTGVTLEIEPSITENDYVIDLRFVPEIVEFEGFINYGSPIQAPSTDIFGNAITSTITDNRIEMPVFSTRRVNTSLSIYDGYTVAVGGLIREDVQNVNDSVPIFGDIPIIGRLFQSKAENHIKSNLIIFVTAQIIDATGRPLRGADSDKTDLPPVAPTPSASTPVVDAPPALEP
ncbi:MAG: Amuc_1098 family type IV pilus outer membrane protein [Verrucomicrobiota bacterium]